MSQSNIKPFDNCPAIDGYHCQTNSLAKIYHFYKHPLSEDMLLGLGAGMNFMYWQQKGVPPFIGARGNNKDFFQDIGKRTGVLVEEKTTTSEKKARQVLLEYMEKEEPLMVFGDMAYLPWFEFPEDYHFGGHTFVLCGYDGADTLLASDMDPEVAGPKKGFYYPLTLEQVSKARGSPYNPFPPKNKYLTFNFEGFHDPTVEDINLSLKQSTDAMLNPSISNFGIKGIRRTAKEITRWPDQFNDEELRLNLFNIYIYTEIGGTGGGSFRYMYSRFLDEAALITQNPSLSEAATQIFKSGKLFTELGLLFKDAIESREVIDRIPLAEQLYLQIADIEEITFQSIDL